MLNPFLQEEQERFEKEFCAEKIWVVPSKDNRETIEEIKSFLASHDQRLLDKINDAIVEEINICHSENTPTSRLTSLYNKIFLTPPKAEIKELEK